MANKISNEQIERYISDMGGREYAGIRPNFNPRTQLSDEEYEKLSPAEAQLYASYDENYAPYSYGMNSGGHINWDRVPPNRRDAYDVAEKIPYKDMGRTLKMQQALYPNFSDTNMVDFLDNNRITVYPMADGVTNELINKYPNRSQFHMSDIGPRSPKIDGMTVEEAYNISKRQPEENARLQRLEANRMAALQEKYNRMMAGMPED